MRILENYRYNNASYPRLVSTSSASRARWKSFLAPMRDNVYEIRPSGPSRGQRAEGWLRPLRLRLLRGKSEKGPGYRMGDSTRGTPVPTLEDRRCTSSTIRAPK